MAIDANMATLISHNTKLFNALLNSNYGGLDIADDILPEYPQVTVGLYYVEVFGRVYETACRNKSTLSSSSISDELAEALALEVRRTFSSFSNIVYQIFYPDDASVFGRSNKWFNAGWPLGSLDITQNLLESGLKALLYLMGPAYRNYANFESIVLQPIVSLIRQIIEDNVSLTVAGNLLADGLTSSDTNLLSWCETLSAKGSYDAYRFPMVINYPNSSLYNYMTYVVPSYSSLSGQLVRRNQLVKDTNVIYVITNPHNASGTSPDVNEGRNLFSAS